MMYYVYNNNMTSRNSNADVYNTCIYKDKLGIT